MMQEAIQKVHNFKSKNGDARWFEICDSVNIYSASGQWISVHWFEICGSVNIYRASGSVSVHWFKICD